jgi:serine/threonine protein kinase
MQFNLANGGTEMNLLRYAMTERNVLSVIDHPFIVKLDAAFQSQDKLFLILQYCPGGDLDYHLHREQSFSEERARIYTAEILLALEELHKKDILYRDLKPENVVLNAEGHACLTDFGLSKEGVFNIDHGAKSFCGSVAYLAPEMLKRVGHGKAVDWYLLGVLLHEMLIGFPPYFAESREEIFFNIEHAPLTLPESLSPEVRDLLKKLLDRNPLKRLGSGPNDAQEIKDHPWFSPVSFEDVFNKKYKLPVLNKPVKTSPHSYHIITFKLTDEKERIHGWSFTNESRPRDKQNNDA